MLLHSFLKKNLLLYMKNHMHYKASIVLFILTMSWPFYFILTPSLMFLFSSNTISNRFSKWQTLNYMTIQSHSHLISLLWNPNLALARGYIRCSFNVKSSDLLWDPFLTPLDKNSCYYSHFYIRLWSWFKKN
jgi:hypothetical protein